MFDQVRSAADRVMYVCGGLVVAGCVAYALGVLPEAWKGLARPLLVTSVLATGVGHATPIVRKLLRDGRMRWLRRLGVATIVFVVIWEAVGPGNEVLETRVLEAFMRYLLPLAGPALIADAAEGWWRGRLPRSAIWGFAGAGTGVLLAAGAAFGLPGATAMLVAGVLGIAVGGITGGIALQEMRDRAARAARLPPAPAGPDGTLLPAADPRLP